MTNTVPSHTINMHFLPHISLGICSPLLLSSVYYFELCGHSLSADDKCTVTAVVCIHFPFTRPAVLTKIHLWMDGTNISQPHQKKKKICVTALSKLATLFPWCPLGCLRPFHCWRTQNTVLSAGALVGWHWEHLWLEGRRGGGAWGVDRGHRSQSHKHCIVPFHSRWGRPNMQPASW